MTVPFLTQTCTGFDGFLTPCQYQSFIHSNNSGEHSIHNDLKITFGHRPCIRFQEGCVLYPGTGLGWSLLFGSESVSLRPHGLHEGSQLNLTGSRVESWLVLPSGVGVRVKTAQPHCCLTKTSLEGSEVLWGWAWLLRTAPTVAPLRSQWAKKQGWEDHGFLSLPDLHPTFCHER